MKQNQPGNKGSGVPRPKRMLQLLELAFEETPSQIAIVGLDYCYRRVNRAHSKLFGLPEERIVGRPLRELWGLDDFRALKPYLDRSIARKRRKRVDFERWLSVKSKNRYYFRGRCISLRWEKGDADDIALILHDLTQLKLAEEALQKKQMELQALSGRVLQAHEEERRRIAQEIHDSFGQVLTDSAIELVELASELPDACEPIEKRVEGIASRLGDLVDAFHDMAYELHPPALEYAGLAAAIEDLCRTFSNRSRVPVHFAARPSSAKLAKDLELALYRVAQESLRNVAEHSGARQVWVNLRWSRREIELSVRDDGAGFRLAGAVGEGLGISGMQERMRLIGGRLVLKSSPGGGTEVTAKAPISESRR
jgi:PAS domain S-box-containing protein